MRGKVSSKNLQFLIGLFL